MLDEPDNLIRCFDCYIVFFTDVYVLCDFALVFATNGCIRVSPLCEKAWIFRAHMEGNV